MSAFRGLVSASFLIVFSASSVFAAGGVKGKIKFDGKSSKGKSVKMEADAKCLAQHAGGFKYEPISVDKSGGLADVFIYVTKGLEGKKFPVPAESKAILDQKGCWYYPRVSGIMVGQNLAIINSDPTMHNVNAMPDFNAAMPAGIKKLEKSFKKSKVMFQLKCNVHPWMKAYVGILDHPYYAVSGKDGSYEIAGLPPGKYTLEAWHEKMGKATKEITVADAGASADFTLQKDKKDKE